MTVKVFTSVVNKPEFLDLQAKLLKKFMLNDYEFFVIDDARDSFTSEQFKLIAEKNDINYIKNTNKLPEPFIENEACANAIQWTYDNIICQRFPEDIIMFIDSDMFLIDYLDVKKYMDGEIFSGQPQHRGHVVYSWNGIMFMDMKKILSYPTKLDFWCDSNIDGYSCDVGGRTYYFFKENNINFKHTSVSYPDTILDINVEKVPYRFEYHHLDNVPKFLHHRAATNWHKEIKQYPDELSFEEKANLFNQIAEKLLKEQDNEIKLKINDVFDKVYCINLDKRTDRWESAQAEFEKHGIIVERVSAIEGGAYGLVETNKKILQDAIDNNYNSILILEDDVEFVEDLQIRFDKAYSHIPEHWNMLYFGGNHYLGQPVPLNEYVSIPQKTLSSHAIAYRNSAYQKMLDKLNTNEPVDVIFSNNLIYFDAFLFFPHLAWQKPGHSDIMNYYVNYDFLR